MRSVRIDHAMFRCELARYVVEYSRKMLNDMIFVINKGKFECHSVRREQRDGAKFIHVTAFSLNLSFYLNDDELLKREG